MAYSRADVPELENLLKPELFMAQLSVQILFRE